jgi:hypothetical protein
MCPHGASSFAETQIPEIHETFEKLREEGKVRALGVSAHNDPAGVLRGAIASCVYSVAMIAFNATNRSYVEPALEEAKKADVGVIATKLAQAVFEPDRSTNRRSERVAVLDRLVPGDHLNTSEDLHFRPLESKPHRRHFKHGGREAGQGESERRYHVSLTLRPARRPYECGAARS